MKLQILSDLHFEVWEDNGRRFAKQINSNGDVDALILAGDIVSWVNPKKAREQLSRLTDKFPVTLYVPGNHEYWHHKEQDPYRHTELMKENVPDGVKLLGPGEIVSIGKQHFLGGTGWFPRLRVQEQYLMNHWPDFRYAKGIQESYMHLNSDLRKWLNQELTSDDIVITHHIPSTLGISDRWKGSQTNCFFFADFDDLITEKQPKLWVFGHTHDPCDKMHGNTRLVCNPLGYPLESRGPGFEVNKIVEV